MGEGGGFLPKFAAYCFVTFDVFVNDGELMILVWATLSFTATMLSKDRPVGRCTGLFRIVDTLGAYPRPHNFQADLA